MRARTSTHRHIGVLSATVVAIGLVTASAQTKITPPETNASPAEDVKLGLEAAAQVRKELPMLNDERVDAYVEGIGARLVAVIPPEFQHPEFMYTFDVINQKEINAFALPGGPMFLNRGMMEAAKTEAEVAGVMGHEISHVALRHGIAQSSKTLLPGLVSVGGQIAESILGGTLGGLVGLGSQVGAAAWATKYTREFESQADLLGARILARAGYDPREMANMFKTIEAEGSGGGPEWLSSHPNPGNRYNSITKEAASLEVQGAGDTGQFGAIQARFKELGPSYTAEQIAKQQKPTAANTSTGTAGGRRPVVDVTPPSRQLRAYTPADFLRVGVPSNWSQVNATGGTTYAPQGAHFQDQNGQHAFTHGVQLGVTRGTGNLQRDTQALIEGFARSNPKLKQQAGYRRDSISGRRALTASFSNVSDVTGQPEYVAVSTTTLPDGNILFIIGVAPQSEARTYDQAFRRVRESVRISNPN